MPHDRLGAGGGSGALVGRLMPTPTVAWTLRASLPAGRSDPAAAAVGSLVYVLGGSNTNTTYRYDPSSDSWSSKKSMGFVRSGACAVTVGGLLYAIGGNNASTVAIRSVECYDPATNLWTAKANMPLDRARAAAVVINGLVYVFGGQRSGAAASTTYCYDPSADSWTSKAVMPGARYYLAAAVVNGKAYVVGGSDGSAIKGDVYCYDPSADSWTTLTSIPGGRYQHAAVALGNKLYVIGGTNTAGTDVATVSQYDPADDSWSDVTSLSASRANLAAAVPSNGRVYAVGGSSNSSVNEQGLFNTAPNAPSPTGPPSGGVLDLASANRFEWVPSDPDPGDSQSKFDLHYRVTGTSTWTTVSSSTPNSYWDAPAGTFTAGDYEWQVRTYDSLGLVGPYSASAFFTASTVPAGPSITAPTNGSAVGVSETVTWSTPDQSSYQVRRIADDAGAPDTSTVYFDTGEVVASTTRSLAVGFPTNGRWEHVQVRVKDAGLWSPWASVRVQVSWTPPPMPLVALTPVTVDAAIDVAITNPAPGAGEPTVAFNDVYLSAPGVEEYRAATLVAPNSTWRFWTPAAGVDYTARVMAVGSNGTTSLSAGEQSPEMGAYAATYMEGY